MPHTTASVTDDAAAVIAEMFNEADRRDPEHKLTWVALVDGNDHQIDRIKTEARKRKITIPLIAGGGSRQPSSGVGG